MPLYELTCATCLYLTEKYFPCVVHDDNYGRCPECDRAFTIEVSLPAFHDFYQSTHTTMCSPYTTTNIHPNGKPIEIRSHAQLERECKKYGVQPAWGKENRIG